MSENIIEKPIDRSWPQYLEEKFIPHIATSVESADRNFHNCIAIDLDLSKTSTLKFDHAMLSIDKALKEGYLLFFYIDLKLSKNFEDYFDEIQFESIRLGLKTFQEKILKPYLAKTFGIGFKFGQLKKDFISPYQFSKLKDYLMATYLDFERHFEFSCDDFDSKLKDSKLLAEIDLYQVGLVSEYFHRLASCIQEPIEIYSFFDFSSHSPLDILRFISLERFPYMRVGMYGCDLLSSGLNVYQGKMLGGTFGMNPVQMQEPKLGLVFPIDSKLSKSGEDNFNQLINQFLSLQIPFYTLYEDSMTENWQNLEQLLVHSQFVDRSVKRKCQGFSAAQGQVIVFGEEIGVFDEIKFEDFLKDRGRGI